MKKSKQKENKESFLPIIYGILILLETHLLMNFHN